MTITVTSTPGIPHISGWDADQILDTDHVYRTVQELHDNGEMEDA